MLSLCDINQKTDLIDHELWGHLGTDSIRKCPNRPIDTGQGLKEDIDGFDNIDSTSLYTRISELLTFAGVFNGFSKIWTSWRILLNAFRQAVANGSLQILHGHCLEDLDGFDFDYPLS